jgi:capsular polysaccharide biosynthesis protein
MRDIAQAVLRRPGVVLLTVLAFSGVAIGISLWRTPIYDAFATLLVGQEADFSDFYREPLEGLVFATAEAVESPSIAREVIQRLDLRTTPDELLKNLTAEQVEAIQFIRLSYRDTDPERAQRVVNAVGVVSSERIPEKIGIPDDIVVTVWQRASVPTTPISPDPLRNGLLALVLGLAVGIGLALLMERRML